MRIRLVLFNKILYIFAFVVFVLLIYSSNPKKTKAYNIEESYHETRSYSISMWLNEKKHPNYYNWLEKYDLKDAEEYSYGEKVHLQYYDKIYKDIIDNFNVEYGVLFNTLSTSPCIYKSETVYSNIFEDLSPYKEMIQMDFVESIKIKYIIWAWYEEK